MGTNNPFWVMFLILQNGFVVPARPQTGCPGVVLPEDVAAVRAALTEGDEPTRETVTTRLCSSSLTPDHAANRAYHGDGSHACRIRTASARR